MSEKKPLPPLESREQAQIRSSEFLRQYDEGLEIGHLRPDGPNERRGILGEVSSRAESTITETAQKEPIETLLNEGHKLASEVDQTVAKPTKPDELTRLREDLE